MKRSPLKRRRSKPRPAKDRDVVKDYCERFDFDEPLCWLGLRLTLKGPVQEHEGIIDQGRSGDLKRNLELNHLWSNRERPDFRSNFMRMLKEGHDWYDLNLPAGRTLCVLTKLRKREKLGEPEEFDFAEINEAAGKSVLGVIEGYELPAWCEPYRDECVSRLAKLAMEQEQRA